MIGTELALHNKSADKPDGGPMNSKSFSENLAFTASKILIGFLLLAAVSVAPESAVAQLGPRPCSNQTLIGDYGFTIDGTIVGANILFRGLAMQHYDGNGKITQVDHIIFDGVPPSLDWTPGIGTYTVNPDCTGVAVIDSPSNPVPIHLHFVVVNNGKEIRQVVDANAVIAIGIKVN